jgi:hypothetical protein
MEKNENTGLQVDQTAQGVWERRTADRRLGQNQLFGSFRVEPGVRVVSRTDPTDNVLAAIASILDEPTDKPTHKHKSVEKPAIPIPEEVPVASQPPEPAAADADGYTKLGPGPLDAIRFKWVARPAGDGTYFVDETIGDNSRAMTSGPMPKQDAVRLIDERERDARRRFDALKNEMTGPRASATNSSGHDAGKM